MRKISSRLLSRHRRLSVLPARAALRRSSHRLLAARAITTWRPSLYQQQHGMGRSAGFACRQLHSSSAIWAADKAAADEPVIDAEFVEESAGAESTPTQPEETVTGPSESHGFQAETLKLLDIVTHSLYSNRDVFIRELVSNASDALEKIRQLQLTGKLAESEDYPLRISLTTDSTARQLVIQDWGVGMTKEEMIQNLGTIARSGTEDFVRQLKEAQESGSETKDVANIIGQFGVGFYSVFMVANSVKVYSRAASSDGSSKGFLWSSDGSGKYEIAEAEGVQRGTKIIVDLKPEYETYSQQATVEDIVKRYSNFVGFDIELNGKKANTVKALWTLPKSQISPKEHEEFYKFISGNGDKPQHILHYAVDTPMNLRALLYIGETHIEKMGLGRLEPGVSLFCRKVLIQSKAKGLLPEWLRFVKGVVDSEDVSLAVSREHLQDEIVIQRLRNVITKRILKFLKQESAKKPEKYRLFWNEFSNFLKEGALTDFAYKDDIADLLLYETSSLPAGELCSLQDYVNRMPEGQKEIYYQYSPTRSLSESSPYYESFKRKGTEVIFVYQQVDQFVMQNLVTFKGKRVLSAESSEVQVDEDDTASDKADTPNKEKLSALCSWMETALGTRVVSVKLSKRLSDTPAIVVDIEMAQQRKMMRMLDPSNAMEAPKNKLEINGGHPIIVKLAELLETDPALATDVAEQILDNALISADLLDNGRQMVPRMNSLLARAIGAEPAAAAEPTKKPEGSSNIDWEKISKTADKKSFDGESSA